MRSYPLALLVLVLFAVVAQPAMPAGPATLGVCADACAFATIQAAIQAAQPGDTVLVKPGVYSERVAWDKPGLTLRAEQGPALTVIDATRAPALPGSDADHATAVAACGGAATVEGFTLRAGKHIGGGIGVLLCGGDGNRVADNRVAGAWLGIASLYSSSDHNIVERNTVAGTSGFAVAECCGLVGNLYRDNILTGNAHGMLISGQGSRVVFNRLGDNGAVALACEGPVDARANYWGSPLGPALGLAGNVQDAGAGGACRSAEVAPWCVLETCDDQRALAGPLSGLFSLEPGAPGAVAPFL
jgi:parallel beta-helix repeat protein